MIRTSAGKLNDRFGRQVTEEDTSLILKAIGAITLFATDIFSSKMQVKSVFVD